MFAWLAKRITEARDRRLMTKLVVQRELARLLHQVTGCDVQACMDQAAPLVNILYPGDIPEAHKSLSVAYLSEHVYKPFLIKRLG